MTCTCFKQRPNQYLGKTIFIQKISLDVYSTIKIPFNKNADFIGVADALEGKDGKDPTNEIAKKIGLSMLISTGFSGLVGAITNPAACLNPPACTLQANLPRNTGNNRQEESMRT